MLKLLKTMSASEQKFIFGAILGVRGSLTGASSESLPYKERLLLAMFRLLNARGQEKLVGFIDDMIKSRKYEPSLGLAQK